MLAEMMPLPPIHVFGRTLEMVAVSPPSALMVSLVTVSVEGETMRNETSVRMPQEMPSIFSLRA